LFLSQISYFTGSLNDDLPFKTVFLKKSMALLLGEILTPILEEIKEITKLKYSVI
jgi:hypothetical protein